MHACITMGYNDLYCAKYYYLVPKKVTCYIELYFVCLFGVFRLENFYGDVTNYGEGLQILTYARHSWP